MDEKQMTLEMVDVLESKGELRVVSEDMEIIIQSVDAKEGYSFVSNTNEEFEDSREAVEWTIEQFEGIENIEEWD